MLNLSLDQWLKKLETQHPVTIDLGLERIQAVADRLSISRIANKVVTVAGTNGKGSFVRTLEQSLLLSGHRVAAYTSPHLVHYNERIRVCGKPVSDEAICQAFEQIDQARGQTSLTYFEVGTLAALLIMAGSQLDVAILEVGLGGRFDAVNIIDGDIAVITPIALDHMDWLGATREQISLEKAGIARQGKPVICADEDPPEVLTDRLKELGCRILALGQDFAYQPQHPNTWDITVTTPEGRSSRIAGLPLPQLPLPSVAAALQCAAWLGEFPGEDVWTDLLCNLQLEGRFQQVEYRKRKFILDVAHNPAAASHLAEKLRGLALSPTVAIAAIMADKDVEGFVAALAPAVSHWYLGDLPSVGRSLPATELAAVVYTSGGSAEAHASIPQALDEAVKQTHEGDTILVCGSFFTVGEVLTLIQG